MPGNINYKVDTRRSSNDAIGALCETGKWFEHHSRISFRSSELRYWLNPCYFCVDRPGNKGGRVTTPQ